MKLSIKSIEAVKPSDKRQEFPDQLIKGLRLVVQPSGIKSFQLRYKYAGQSKRLTLGRWDKGLTLATARDKAREALLKLEDGSDPLHEKRQKLEAAIERTKKATIGAAMARYEVEHLDKLRSGKNAKIFLQEFKAEYADLELTNFTKDMFREMLQNIIAEGYEVKSNRVCTHIKGFMNWAEEKGLIEYNHLAKVKKPVKEEPRERFLSDAEINLFWKATEAEMEPWGALYRTMLLLGQRKTEVAYMRFSEIVEGNHWHLPSARTKNKSRHDVFLPTQVMAMVHRENRIVGDFIFSTTGSGPVKGFTKPLSRLRAKMNELAGYELEQWQPHDLRRTLETNLAKLQTPQNIIDRIVNHRSGVTVVQRTYNQYDYRAEKEAALQKWADHVEELVA